MSFQESGGPWPPHCIQDTEGAAFHPELGLPDGAIKISKGVRFDQDQYSAFHLTGFGERLREDGIRRLWTGGLAQDVCVRASVIEARSEGFEVCLIGEATRPVTPEGGQQAMEAMREAGARIEPGA